MKRLMHWATVTAIVLLYACSGPPNLKPPDRPPSLEGVIVSVDVSAESIDIVDLGVQPADGDQQVRHVKVDQTVILTPGNVYPQTVAILKEGRVVRVWLHEATASSTAFPMAEYIEIDAVPGT